MASKSSKMNVVLGTMSFGHEGNEGVRVSKSEDISAILETFRNHGYRDLDSARSYGGGTTEECLAQVDWKGKGFTVATKIYPTKGKEIAKFMKEVYSHEPEDIRACVKTCLENLKTDKIDLFYLHVPDRATPFEETLREINKLHLEGKLSRLGVSNFQSWEVAKLCEICRANDWLQPTVYQGQYHMFHRAIEAELMPCLRHYSMSFFAYNPLAGGLFTSKLIRKVGTGASDLHLDSKSWYDDMVIKRYGNEHILAAMDILTPVLEKYAISAKECALRWIVHHSMLSTKSLDAVIIGASKVDRLEDNLVDLEKGPLPQEVVEALDAGWQKARILTLAYWFVG